MKTSIFSIVRKTLIIIVACGLLSSFQSLIADAQSVQTVVTDTVCRFGVTSPMGSEGYDIASLGIGSYLDWLVLSNPSLPVGVEHIRVLRLRDDLYPNTLAEIKNWVKAYPGSVWMVGNEPDTYYEDQDALVPEIYADRYYELATSIRKLDKTALIAFGSVVQPTPIRLRYLDKAWNELIALAGSPAAASKLVDIWSIHGFILNEVMGSWGTGVPPGFLYDHEDAVVITDLTDTYSIEIFQQRVTDFRSWMAERGQRDKPLWITEYGSLLPPIDPPGHDYSNVSDEDTAAFMLASFNFMLNATDNQTGLPGDGNQLVQRWFWYSLNGRRYTFGGTIFDPDNGNAPTLVGESFIEFQATHLIQPDLFPASLSITPLSFNPEHTLGNYRVNLVLGNNLFNDASCAQAWLYDGNPDAGGILIAGPIPASAIQSYNGMGRVSVYWDNVQPMTPHSLYVRVEPIGVADTNPDNNMASFSVYLELPELIFMPFIHR